MSMPPRQDPDELLQQGIAAARAGETDAARQLIARALQADPQNVQAWLWLTSVAKDDEERVRILQQVLEIEPQNEHAIRGLQALGAWTEPEPEPPPVFFEQAEPDTLEESITDDSWLEDVEPEAVEVESFTPAPQGIPLIGPDVMTTVLQEAEGIVGEAMQDPAEVDFGDVTWVATQPQVVRERTRLVVNPVIVGGVVGGLLVLGGVAFGIYSLISGPRDTETAQVASAPRTTPVNTPTHTPAPSPTATLLPGQPTFTPEATIALDAPRGDLDFGLTPTLVYFSTVHPDNPPLDNAIEKFHMGDYEAVVEEIPAARESGPDQPDSYYFEGLAYAFLGQYQRAANVVNQGLTQDPDIAALHAALGYIYNQQGDREAGRLESMAAKSLDPVLILPYLTLAEGYREDELYESALAEIDAALALDAHNVEVLVAQGDIYIAQGDVASAAAIGNLAVYVDPTAEAAVMLLAQARIALGQYGQAVVPLEQYLSYVSQASPSAWTLLGEARYLEGNQTQALDAFSRALVLAEESRDVLLRRGTVFLETDAFEEAYADFDSALALDDTLDARSGRAQAAFGSGRFDEALTDVDRVLEDTPLDFEARLLRAKALVETGAYEEAAPELTALEATELADPPALASILEYRGRANYWLTFYGNAITDLERAIDIEETGTRHYYRGLALEATNNVEGAILEYDWILFWDRLYDYPFADDAVERRDNLNAGGEPQGADAS